MLQEADVDEGRRYWMGRGTDRARLYIHVLARWRVAHAVICPM